MANEAIGEDAAGEILLTEMDNDTLLKFVKLDLHKPPMADADRE